MLRDYVVLVLAIAEQDNNFALLPIVCLIMALPAMPIPPRLARAHLQSRGLSLAQYSMEVKESMVEGSTIAL